MTADIEVRQFGYRRRVPTEVGTETKTKQSMAQDCDINFIVKRFKSTGQVSHLAKVQAQYGDFTNADELATMLNQVDEAERLFASLPAAVRRAAGNSPIQFLEMIESPDGLQELMDADSPPIEELPRKEAVIPPIDRTNSETEGKPTPPAE